MRCECPRCHTALFITRYYVDGPKTRAPGRTQGKIGSGGMVKRPDPPMMSQWWFCGVPGKARECACSISVGQLTSCACEPEPTGLPPLGAQSPFRCRVPPARAQKGWCLPLNSQIPSVSKVRFWASRSIMRISPLGRLREVGVVSSGHWSDRDDTDTMPAPAMSATPHIAAAQARPAGRTESLLNGADREFARRPQPLQTSQPPSTSPSTVAPSCAPPNAFSSAFSTASIRV